MTHYLVLLIDISYWKCSLNNFNWWSPSSCDLPVANQQSMDNVFPKLEYRADDMELSRFRVSQDEVNRH